MFSGVDARLTGEGRLTAAAPVSFRANPNWRDWRVWGVVAVITVLIGVITNVMGFVIDTSGRQYHQWVLRSWPIWVTRGGLVPLIFVLTNRLQVNRANLGRTLALHLFLALMYPWLHLALAGLVAEIFVSLSFALGFAVVEPMPMVFLHTLRSYTRSSLPIDFLWYWGTVGVFYALYFYSESQRALVATARLQASLTEVQLQALKSQLNPHFLFNTLNTISVLALHGDRLAAVGMIEKLSDLLRIALDD